MQGGARLPGIFKARLPVDEGFVIRMTLLAVPVPLPAQPCAVGAHVIRLLEAHNGSRRSRLRPLRRDPHKSAAASVKYNPNITTTSAELSSADKVFLSV